MAPQLLPSQQLSPLPDGADITTYQTLSYTTEPVALVRQSSARAVEARFGVLTSVSIWLYLSMSVVNPNAETTMNQKDLTLKVRPLRETIERSLTWEGGFTQPEPIQIGPFEVSVLVVVRRGFSPYAIWYRATRDGRTVVEVDRQPEFVRILARKLAEEAK